jgi:hypothetical protein
MRLAVLFVLWPSLAFAQIVNPYQATANWQVAGADIEHRTEICATILAPTYDNGSVESSTAINAAITACPAGQVVKLGPGRFRTNDVILLNKSNVTLRGSGVGVTILEKQNGMDEIDEIVTMGSTVFGNGDETTDVFLTVDAAAGDYTVTVSDATGYAAGQYIKIDADEWTTADWVVGAPLKNGGIERMWGTDRMRFRKRDPDYPPGPLTLSSLDDYSRFGRVINEIKEVTAVTADGVGGAADTITFATPLTIAYPLAKSSQVIRYTGVHVHIEGAGIEDLTFTGGSNETVRVTTAAKSWIRNIECRNFLGPCVSFYDSYRIELRDSYIHHARNPVPGGGGYCIGMRDGSSNILIENNIIMHANKMIAVRASGAGSVFAYNYAQDALINYLQTFMEVGINGSHYAGSHHMLFEGNQAQNSDSDATHGPAIYMTTFRNWLEGERRTYATSVGRSYRAVGLMDGAMWHAFFGNVLGKPVFNIAESNWIYNDPGDGDHPPDTGFDLLHAAIWRLGYSIKAQQLADPWVTSTVIRMGNFDYLTDTQQWHNGDPVTIEDSLYLSEKPEFFGSLTWPWVDPVNGVTHVLPAKERYEAIVQKQRHRVRFIEPDPDN